MSVRLRFVLLLLPVVAGLGCGTTRPTNMQGLMAYARLEGPRGVTDGADGLVLFVREGAGIRVTGRVTGLTPGQHGFHVHEHGSCSPADSDGDGLEEAAGAAGAHFDPTNAIHGPRSANRSRRHAGDLGNLDADASGIARIAFTDSLITLDGRREIIGRALIIHSDRDDFSEDPAGNAGRRISCGRIESGTTNDLDRLTAELGGMGE
jgi:Cu-Zn family superoxide dismutase